VSKTPYHAGSRPHDRMFGGPQSGLLRWPFALAYSHFRPETQPRRAAKNQKP
jgi:hypothetical protein